MGNNNKKGGELESYIENQLAAGKTRDDITKDVKDMGWSDDEIDICFLRIDDRRKARKRKIIFSISATALVIIAFAFIILFSPRSPVKYEKTQVIKAAGAVETYSEDIHDIIYDNATGQRKNIPIPLAERMARAQREERENLTNTTT